MDKRILFLFVFIFTLFSTASVSFISLYMDHSWLDTVLYALATMWVVGVASQLLVHFLYLNILRPIEERKYKEKVKDELRHDIPLDEVERIDDVHAGRYLPNEHQNISNKKPEEEEESKPESKENEPAKT